MDRPLIEFTGTIKTVLKELEGSGDIHAAEVVRKILEHHKEYASGTAREVLAASWPGFDQEESKPAVEWLSQVGFLFDPLLVNELHGRLAILGLSRLDKTLGKHLRSFTTELKKDLVEDFDSLLLPEPAGKEKYRRTFLKILQNRAKISSDPEFDKRESGFLIMTHGGERMDVLNALCFQQRYNSCLTARYQLLGNSGLADFIRIFRADLDGIPQGDFGTVGKFLPELGRSERPGANRLTWPRTAPSLVLATVSTNKNTASQGPLADLLSLLNSATLPIGQRLVLFLEWRGLPGDTDADSIGLTNDIVQQLTDLQERVGIVISGLPESIRAGIPGRTVYQLEVPADEEPKRSQKLENDTPRGPDRLNIVDEVQALADAIVLKEMQPPLVVGVFGGWGSGKSFVLHLIEERIHERRCEGIAAGDAALANYPFVGHPYLVHFDAWTYAKGNLWASLMQTTLVELDRQLSLEHELGNSRGFDWRAPSPIWKLLWQLSDEQREIFSKTELGRQALEKANTFENSGSPGRLWTELERLRSVERQRLDKEEEDLRQLRLEQVAARRELEADVDKALSTEARWVAWAPIWDEMNALAGDKFKESDAPTFGQIVKAVSVGRKLLLGIKNLSLPAATFILVALLGGILVAELNEAFDWYAQIGGALVALGAPVLRAWEWFEKRRNAYDRQLAIAQESKDKLRQQRIEEQIRIAAEKSSGLKVANLNARVGEQEATVDRIRKRIGITGQARSLNDFLKTRIEEGLYQKELGLLDQIQNDIQELSDTLLPSKASGVMDRKSTDKLFPRGDPRVVLLIDDLDRCPPDKVVEVLEAAQLLVKTQLFVVVIAIDVRYVTRALEAEYKDVLVRSGEPSGLDYIEKIIQIPYRVRSVSAPGIRNFLLAQMDIIEPEETGKPAEVDAPAVAATQIEAADNADEQTEKARLAATALATHAESINLPSEALQFEPEEYAAISESCSALAVSPRTMKRLVNVFKLLKIIWYRQGLEDGPANDVKKAMLSILALCARYPEVLRKLLAEMESFFRAEQNDLQKSIVDFAAEVCREGAKIALYPPDWEQVANAVADPNFFPEDLTFSHLGEANLHLLSSFSFVGETDSEREATLQRGYYMR